MLIQCTERLINELNIRPGESTEEDRLFCWHADLVSVGRKNMIVLVNDNNSYATVIDNYKNLNKAIVRAIEETFYNQCINNEIIKDYLSKCEKVIYTKGKVNEGLKEACEVVTMQIDSLVHNHMHIADFNKMINDIPLAECNIPANKKMCNDLEKCFNKPIFKCRAAVMNITLDLQKYNVWRKVVIPLTYMFEDLQNIMGSLFAVVNHAQHMFHIEPDVTITDFPDNSKQRQETSVKLNEFIPGDNLIKYEYGSKVKWKLSIAVEEIIDDYDKNYPECIAGKGIAPTDKVAVNEYDEYIENVFNKDIKEIDFLLRWGIERRYLEFNIEQANYYFRR